MGPPPIDDTPTPAVLIVTSSADNSVSIEHICLMVLAIIVLIIIVPLFLHHIFAAYLICNNDVTKSPNAVPHGKKESIYQKLIINISVQWLRRKVALGSELWKWSMLIVVFSCGYPVINVAVSLWR
ncbi:hypothetical protein Nepgr_030970 [Nepenthes gracilis]|uniref:Uncharacterized protein n=1 Tax=Nepenthes gracilis TaxID=150966 RepID=A0AAD3Y4D2_NEPGR|nr:hypothetical protein Nepgr_030970 [Nepenthes gracilis]